MLDVIEARRTVYDAITAAVGILVPAAAQAFPGVAVSSQALPRLEVVQVAAQHPLRDLKGRVYSEEGVIQVFVVGQKGSGEAAAMAIAQTIADAMPPGTSYAISGGGTATITDIPNIRPGYADDTSWRVPVEIQYLAT